MALRPRCAACGHGTACTAAASGWWGHPRSGWWRPRPAPRRCVPAGARSSSALTFRCEGTAKPETQQERAGAAGGANQRPCRGAMPRRWHASHAAAAAAAAAGADGWSAGRQRLQAGRSGGGEGRQGRPSWRLQRSEPDHPTEPSCLVWRCTACACRRCKTCWAAPGARRTPTAMHSLPTAAPPAARLLWRQSLLRKSTWRCAGEPPTMQRCRVLAPAEAGFCAARLPPAAHHLATRCWRRRLVDAHALSCLSVRCFDVVTAKQTTGGWASAKRQRAAGCCSAWLQQPTPHVPVVPAPLRRRLLLAGAPAG